MPNRILKAAIAALVVVGGLGTWNNLQGKAHPALLTALEGLGHSPDRLALESMEYGPRIVSRFARGRFVPRGGEDLGYTSVEVEITRGLPFMPWITRSLKTEKRTTTVERSQ